MEDMMFLTDQKSGLEPALADLNLCETFLSAFRLVPSARGRVSFAPLC